MLHSKIELDGQKRKDNGTRSLNDPVVNQC